jgi:uncharacterized protein (DUF4213/DUF364 family)
MDPHGVTRGPINVPACACLFTGFPEHRQVKIRPEFTGFFLASGPPLRPIQGKIVLQRRTDIASRGLPGGPDGEYPLGVNMKILKDLISTLNFNTAVKDIRQGIFHTGVLTRYCGLAATLARDALRHPPPMVKEPGFLLHKSAQELARLSYSSSILEAAIGMATINSLLEIDENICIELNAAELIMERGQNKRVAVVGHFPFIPKIKKAAKKLWVIEKNPKEGDFSEADAGNLIPKADVVAITGTALTHHTMEHLIELCNPRAYVIALGDTAPLSPILFDHRLNAISGTRVNDAALALRCVSQGANFRQIKGVKRLTLMK